MKPSPLYVGFNSSSFLHGYTSNCRMLDKDKHIEKSIDGKNIKILMFAIASMAEGF